MSKGEIIKGYSGVAFFEYTSWCHRYKVLGDNGKVKYLKLKGFQTEDEAVESYSNIKNCLKKHKENFLQLLIKI